MERATYLLQMTLIRLGRGALSAWYEWLRGAYEEKTSDSPANESKDLKET